MRNRLWVFSRYLFVLAILSLMVGVSPNSVTPAEAKVAGQPVQLAETALTSTQIILPSAQKAPTGLLNLTKSASPNIDIPLNGVITYTVTLSNPTDTNFTAVTLTDTLPTGIHFNSWILQNGATVNGNVITWVGDKPAHHELTLIYTAMVDNDPSLYGKTLFNTAAYNNPSGAGQGYTQAAVSIATLPKLSLEKRVAPLQGIQAGGVLTYTLKISNTGGLLATGATVTDTLPAGVTFKGWVQQNGAVQQGNQITWTGDVPGMGSQSIVFSATYNATPFHNGQTVANTATLTSSYGNGTSSASFSTGYRDFLAIIFGCQPNGCPGPLKQTR